ncbi:metal-sulfur cluster assembly factor [Rhodococcus oryzae]|uniref:Metal-sulfur cluster assembly factor n=1 Tax=Rhodococcus oryzae TaxID=2571143 RepID=A0ABY2RKQ7_9NOCA|nr:metal-sulfur cluster assembly factor [Rhodococcus oryzae]TJZ78348.1 metal-sulfur cluster assembly factor [Rhodococcus oryzae]
MTETQANAESTEDQAVQESAPAADEQAVIELTPDQQAVVDELEEAMRDVVDPELGINVVDLGLVYGISVDAEDVAIVDMTLTSAACPLTDVIEEQARGALVKSGLVNDLKINWVWMPPWGPDKITEDGRDQLRALGFTV